MEITTPTPSPYDKIGDINSSSNSSNSSNSFYISAIAGAAILLTFLVNLKK